MNILMVPRLSGDGLVRVEMEDLGGQGTPENPWRTIFRFEGQVVEHQMLMSDHKTTDYANERFEHCHVMLEPYGLCLIDFRSHKKV